MRGGERARGTSRTALRRGSAVAALIVLAGLVLLAVTSVGVAGLGGWWSSDYRTTSPLVDGGRPTLDLLPAALDGDGLRWGPHPFGQDDVGRDLFALTMHGLLRSVSIALLAGGISTALGTAIGLAAGSLPGWPDGVLMRATDVLIATPSLLLTAALARTAGGGTWMLAALLGTVLWTSLARLVRAEVLSLRERDFVLAARGLGANWWQVTRSEILPNLAGTIVVSATVTMPAAVLTESSISFVGLGIQPPDTSLGLLMSQYQDALLVRPWLFWWPSALTLVTTLGLAVVAEAVHEGLDSRQARPPRPRREPGRGQGLDQATGTPARSVGRSRNART